MKRIHARQVIAPKAKLGDGEKTDDEDANLQRGEAVMCCPAEHNWQRNNTGKQKHANEIAPADEKCHKNRECQSARKPAPLLDLRYACRGALNNFACLFTGLWALQAGGCLRHA